MKRKITKILASIICIVLIIAMLAGSILSYILR